MKGKGGIDRRTYIGLLAGGAVSQSAFRSRRERDNGNVTEGRRTTENHEYFKTGGEDTDWRKSADRTVDRLDTDVEIRDTEPRLDAYRPKRGAKFLALDTEREFIGDGSQWRELASSGTSPSVDSVQTRSISETAIYAAEYNTLQGAIDDVTAGETVVLPAGTTRIQNPPLAIPPRVTIRGNRAGSTLRLPDGANTHAIVISEGSTGVTLEKFRLAANGENQDTSVPRGDLHVIQKESDASSILYRDITVLDAAKGAAIANDGGNDIVFIDCNGHRGGKNGAPCDFIFNNQVTSLHVSGCYVENFTDTAVAQDNVRNTTVYGNTFKDCKSQAVSFVKNSSGGTIVNNRIINSGDVADGGIVVGPFGTDNRPTDVVVANNVVRDCSTNGIFVAASRVGTSGNVVTGNDGSGIVYRGADYGVVLGNVVAGNGTTSSPAPGILLSNADPNHSIHNTVGMNNTHDAGNTQSVGIETTSAAENFNAFVGNSASGHTDRAWDVSGRQNKRVGNSPPMPLGSGVVSLDAGTKQSVWSNSYAVLHPNVSIMAVSGRGEADSYVTTDGTRTQVGVREISGENAVEVRWAVWP